MTTGDPWKDHQAVTAIYTEAAADYEAACMSGDVAKQRVADEAFTEADRLYSESLTRVVAADKEARKRRRELPSFETILAHPWTQIPPHLDSIAYPHEVPSDTAGLPVRPGICSYCGNPEHGWCDR